MLHLTRPLNEKTKSFKTALTVDEIRRVGRFLSLTAHDGGYRVVIVDPADDMNVNAANALLKNLEEPPSRTLFVLIAHSLGRLLPTIRSRCQIVRFQPLADDDLLAALAAAGKEPDAAAASAMLARAEGSPRNAIMLADYGGVEIGEALDKLVATADPAAADTHRLADAVAGRDQAIQFGIFNSHALDILARAASEAAGRGDGGRANRISRGLAEFPHCDPGHGDLQSRPQTTRAEHDSPSQRHASNVTLFSSRDGIRRRCALFPRDHFHCIANGCIHGT